MAERLNLAHDIVLRWEKPESAHIPLLKQAGIDVVILSEPHEAFTAAGLRVIRPSEIEWLNVAQIGSAPPAANVALTNGLWPGIRRPPNVAGRGDETASASREPWVDSNGYWIGYLRTLYLNRPPVLGYQPTGLGDRSVPFDSLELALIEAWTAGGNYVLAVEPRYREALLSKDPKAMAAWEQLGRTTRWLKQNMIMFRQTCVPIVTALVEPGVATAEIANLLYRRNVSPYLAPAAAPPPPNPLCRVLVAANLKRPGPAQVKQILAHAEAGGTVVAAASPAQVWWKSASLKPLRSEPDRDFYQAGKGQLVAYKAAVADPSEFALDVIDLVTHKLRAVRHWNAASVIALATTHGPTKRLVHLINYGSPIDIDVQTRVQGHYNVASLVRPDGPPIELPVAKRGSMTEVQVPELKRLGVVIFNKT